jgi:hypothetical protein
LTIYRQSRRFEALEQASGESLHPAKGSWKLCSLCSTPQRLRLNGFPSENLLAESGSVTGRPQLGEAGVSASFPLCNRTILRDDEMRLDPRAMLVAMLMEVNQLSAEFLYAIAKIIRAL